MRLGNEPGWLGAFTREQATGAYRNGSRIVKAREEDGDATPLGTGGTVLGSVDGRVLGMTNPDGSLIAYAYFVEWDNRPRMAVGTTDWKLAPEAPR